MEPVEVEGGAAFRAAQEGDWGTEANEQACAEQGMEPVEGSCSRAERAGTAPEARDREAAA